MSDDRARWDRVKRLFQSALERVVAERARFLREACGTDHAMMREVDSLLAAHQQAGDFAERPTLDRLVGGSATVTSDVTTTDPNRSRGKLRMLAATSSRSAPFSTR